MRIAKLNFPPEELECFSCTCREYGLDPSVVNVGAIGDYVAAGAGMTSRTVKVFFNGVAAEYSGREWLRDFRIDLEAGKWSRTSK
jgi:hypothetical protein